MATISSLRAALTTPVGYFRTIPNITWDSSTPITRSTHFAESVVTLDGKQQLLMMPLTAEAMQHLERLLPLKRHLVSDIVPQIMLLRDELCIKGPAGGLCHCDIVLEPLVEGTPFDTALATAATDTTYAATLLKALNNLQTTLVRCDLSLNNLRAENLILDRQYRLRPRRWYYATEGAGNDSLSFESLRTEVAAVAEDWTLHDIDSVGYDFTDTPPSSDRQGRLSEGLIAVEGDEGWGFVDANGNLIIDYQYDWVGAFHEGRAEVKCGKPMGLIDKKGNNIIPPIYDIVDYDPTTGNTAVKMGNQWAIFNYMGEIITPFSDNKPKI